MLYLLRKLSSKLRIFVNNCLKVCYAADTSMNTDQFKLFAYHLTLNHLIQVTQIQMNLAKVFFCLFCFKCLRSAFTKTFFLNKKKYTIMLLTSFETTAKMNGKYFLLLRYRQKQICYERILCAIRTSYSEIVTLHHVQQ